MKKLIWLLTALSLLTTGLVFALPREVERQYFPFKNFLNNPGFENGKYGWSASGGTFTVEQTSVVSGSFDGKWVTSASAQILSNGAANGSTYQNHNGVGYLWYQTTATDITLQVYDGSAVVTSTVLPATNSAIIKSQPLNFIFQSGKTYSLRLVSGSSGKTIYLDDAYLGDATNVVESTIATDWVLDSGFTASAGFGSVTNKSIWWRRVGDTMFVKGYFTLGTTAGSPGYVQLPPGYTIDSSKMAGTATQRRGVFNRISSGGSQPFGGASASATGEGIMFYDGSTNNQIFISVDGSSSVINKFNPNGGGGFNSGDGMTFEFSVPITGWTTSTALLADQQGIKWTGHHGTDCSWSRSTAAFGDPAGDSTCTLTEDSNRNFGVVVALDDGSGNYLPGVKAKPNQSGDYWVCAYSSPYQSTNADYVNLRLVDGSSNTIAEAQQRSSGANDPRTLPLCGFVSLSNSSYSTVKIQFGSQSGGAINMNANSISTASVRWSFFAYNNQLPMPAVVGMVANPSSTDQTRLASAYITNNGTSCAVSRQDGSWISSVSRTSTGGCDLTLTAGTFSAAPNCTMTAFNSGSAAAMKFNADPTTSSIITKGIQTSGATAFDTDFYIICVGKK